MSKNQPHIAIVVSFSGEGGVERMLINLMEQFVRTGVKVDLLRIKTEGPYTKTIPSSVHIIDLPGRHALSNIIPLYSYLKKNPVQALLVAKDRSCQVVLLAKMLAGVQTRTVIRLGTNLTASLKEKNIWSKWARYLPSRFLYNSANGIIAVSKGVAEDIAKFAKIPLESIQVIPNPVITSKLFENASNHIDHPWFRNKNIPVIVAAGRLTKQKDFSTLIKAVAKLQEKRAVRLMILGEGRWRSYLEDLISELNLQDKVALPGFIINPYPYMQQADVFVLSSLWEGSPNVLTEAMSLGTPVVATDCPSGPREVLQNGNLGPLVQVGDHEGLAEAIWEVLNNPLSSEILQKAVADYRAENSARLYLQALMPDWKTEM